MTGYAEGGIVPGTPAIQLLAYGYLDQNGEIYPHGYGPGNPANPPEHYAAFERRGDVYLWERVFTAAETAKIAKLLP